MSLKKTLLEGTLGLFLREVRVQNKRELAPGFWRLDLAGDSLRGKACASGDKLQVLLDDGPRTYSPFAFDAARGSLSVLSYAHGSSSGAQWGPRAREGEPYRVFGPRGSLALSGLEGDLVLVGDETSFGVARAATELARAECTSLFEVEAPAAAREVLNQLALPGARTVARQAGDAHHEALARELQALLVDRPTATVVLTGKAATIQFLRTRLKAIPHGKLLTKAYWAPGKRGLD